jgi:hypothetical protein
MFILSVNHVAPVCQSQSMHAPRFLLRMGLSYLRFYKRPTSIQDADIDGGVHCASNQVVWRFSDTVSSPPARGSYWFLPGAAMWWCATGRSECHRRARTGNPARAMCRSLLGSAPMAQAQARGTIIARRVRCPKRDPLQLYSPRTKHHIIYLPQVGAYCPWTVLIW